MLREGELAAVLDALEGDLERWSHQCHAASLAIVKAKVFRKARVARGTAPGVGSQHSWVVVSHDAYDRSAMIVDPTLWSYRDDVDGLWFGTYRDRQHFPHGAMTIAEDRWGLIFEWGRPEEAEGDEIVLTPKERWSAEAALFLKMVGPLDRRGWACLANQAPVHGWPAGEIYAAMADTPAVAALVPIDRLGMLTDRNPGGVYLPGGDG